jgi:hypothetical protein
MRTDSQPDLPCKKKNRSEEELFRLFHRCYSAAIAVLAGKEKNKFQEN